MRPRAARQLPGATSIDMHFAKDKSKERRQVMITRRFRLGALSVLAAALMVPAPAAQAAPATIDSTAVSTVTAEGAALEAVIDPHGKATKYHFEYGTADCASNTCASTPEKQVSGLLPPTAVNAPIEGLAPGATYHFRVFAKNADNAVEIESPDRTFTTFRLPGPPETDCPNQAYRGGPSAALPDCRAYEQATPTDKNGADVMGTTFSVQASLAGDAITYYMITGLPGAEGAQREPVFLSRRSAGAWSTAGLLPPAAYGDNADVISWTPDLAFTFSQALNSGAGAGFNLLARQSADGSTSTVAPYSTGADYAFAGASADNSKLFFESADATLAPGAAPGRPNLYLYDRDSATVSLVGRLPDSVCASPPPCAPKDGAFAGPYDWFNGTNTAALASGGADRGYFIQEMHAVSEDGEKAYFTAAGTGKLYLRKGIGGPAPETVQVNASRRSAPDPAGSAPAALQAASADGAKAFFTSSEKLTDDANTGPEVEPAAIERSSLEGEGVVPDLVPTRALGVAVGGGHVYWADPVQKTIGRAELDGSGDVIPGSEEPAFIVPGGTSFETHPYTEPGVVHSAPSTPRYVAVDDEHVYWTNRGPLGGDAGFQHNEPLELPVKGAGTIGRASLDGSGDLVPASVEPEFIKGATNPQGIAVNDTDIYWGNSFEGGNFIPGSNWIGRADIEGDGVDQEFARPSGANYENLPAGLAVDDSSLYVIINRAVSNVGTARSLRRFDFDGNETAFVYFPDGTYGSPPVGEAAGLTVKGKYLYWAMQGKHLISRAETSLIKGNTEAKFFPELHFLETDGAPLGLAADDSHLFWSVNGETPPNPGNDLYRYDAASDQLIDVAPDPGAENGAEVVGVLGASKDGSYVYFAANGDLDGPGGTGQGDCHSAGPPKITNGTCNLYLWHEGEISFIAELEAPSDAGNWLPSGNINLLGPSGYVSSARVSADGRTLLFGSTLKQTGYDSKGTFQLYRFHLGDPEPIRCVSCNPSGGPSGGPGLKVDDLDHTGASHPVFEAQPFLSRNLSADGSRVIFESSGALSVADQNGADGCSFDLALGNGFSCTDVYEWEAPGAGSCTEQSYAYSAQNGGCLFLLSTGTSLYPTRLADVSATGDTAFLYSRDPLVPGDQDQLEDIYAVTVDGGLASQNDPLPPPCEGEACRGEKSRAPAEQGAGSAAFQGPGDKAQPHLRDCETPSARAGELARQSKQLRRRAARAKSPDLARNLRRRSEQLAEQAESQSRQAKSCRRANRKEAR